MAEKAPPVRKITALQSRFADEYAIDLDAPRAAARAGYAKSCSTAKNAYRILHIPAVKERIKMLLAERSKDTEVKASTVIGELARLARCDVGQAFNPDGSLKPIHDIPEDVRRAMSGLEVEETFTGTGENRKWTGRIKKARFWDKNKSLELLAKHLGLLLERTVAIPPEQDPAKPHITYRSVYGSTPAVSPSHDNGTSNGHGTNGHTDPS